MTDREVHGVFGTGQVGSQPVDRPLAHRAHGQTPHLPVAPATTAGARLSRLAAELGAPRKTCRTAPRTVPAARWINPLMREMQHPFEAPVVMAVVRPRTLLAMEPPPLGRPIRATARWVRGRRSA